VRVWLRRIAGAIFAFVAGAAYFFAFPSGAPGGASSAPRDRWTDLGIAVAIGLAALAFFVVLEIAEARRKRAMQDPLARWDDTAARRRREQGDG
jgi:uncharacterized membrane protein